MSDIRAEEVEVESVQAELGPCCVVAVFGGVGREGICTPLHCECVVCVRYVWVCIHYVYTVRVCVCIYTMYCVCVCVGVCPNLQ